jgi:formamidopyrimidine-DNA glycosylase
MELALRGRRIDRVLRRAKNILIYTSGRGGVRVLRIHLRMTGDLSILPDARMLPAASRMLLLFRGGSGLVFTDARALGRVHLHSEEEIRSLLEELGPEPLSRGFTVDWLAAAARQSRQPAKLFLMDQRRIAGLGNIYAAEALFQAGIHPERKMDTLRKPSVARLHGAIVNTLRQAVQRTSANYRRPGEWNGDAGEIPFQVYGRSGKRCPRCGAAIENMRQGGRSTYYCPGCQR